MYRENFGNIPNRDKIKYFLREDNPNFGPWVKHSYLVGKTARNMAKELGLDKDLAYAIGCLHDIGKYEKNLGLSHTINGFHILRSETFFFPARIAISHAFVLKDLDSYPGRMDLDSDQVSFIEDFLFQTEYNDYDRLIQLLDGSIKYEYLGIEKRAKDRVERYGENPLYEENIKKLKELEKYFASKLKYPIVEYTK